MNSHRLSALKMRGKYNKIIDDFGDVLTWTIIVEAEDSFGRITESEGDSSDIDAMWHEAQGDELIVNGGLLEVGDAVAAIKSSVSIDLGDKLTLSSIPYWVKYINIINCQGNVLKHIGLTRQESG